MCNYPPSSAGAARLTMQSDEKDWADSRPKLPVKGDYPRVPSLRGLAAVTFHSLPDDMPTPTTALDADSRLSTWRRWKAAHRERSPTRRRCRARGRSRHDVKVR